ncbi:MAG TPA: hypothetical protein VLA82_06805 [Actinomycetota bacterium]|nr:hypothetical protein [Actinomycetota bacterium]
MGDKVTASGTAHDLLRRSRNVDGGYGPRPGAPSEPEPTALTAIALDDDAARAWLVSNQRNDGSFGLVDGFVRDEAATAIAALALAAGHVQERALDHLEALEAERVPFSEAIPQDGSITGWPWTDDTFGWVEPTSRATLALKRFRPGSPRIEQGVALLRDRRSVGGGWNYGNRLVLGEELPPFAHTTAIAVLALHGLDDDLEREGSERLRSLWREERDGPISLALSRAAFTAVGDDDEVRAVERALDDVVHGSDLLADTVTAAWIAIVTGDGLRRILP